jgi:type 1 glutamine amidotransferase/nicotinamidase-related amidase
MNAVVAKAREQGVLIIHCPSDTMKFYEGTAGRRLAQAAPAVTPRVPLQRWCALDRSHEAPLPIDDSDGGCDDSPPCRTHTAWKQQTPAIEIKDGDAITDSAEAYHLMQQRGIDNVIVMGVHLNMCVLGRPFSIRQMVKQGRNVLLVRDLTDTMYNSRKRPYVPHCVGTDLMVEHVERYWCPTISSVAFLGGAEHRFQEDRRPHVVFLVGDDEYKTGETVPAWARKELAWRGIQCTFALEDPARKGVFPQLAALANADALFVSLRRRALRAEQMALIRNHLASSRAVIGIRTASHAFGAREVGEGEVKWDTFDREVFGGHYQNHYGKGADTLARTAAAPAHPVLTGLPTNELRFTSHLYRSRDLAPTTTVLLNGQLADKPDVVEPLAWVNTNANRRVFYTSLGSPEDFQQPAFRQLLVNAVLWAVDRPVPPELAQKP